MCSTVLLTIYTFLYRRPLEYFHPAWLKFYTYWIATPISTHSYPQPLASTILADSMSLTTLDTSYKWNHEVFFHLWLAYFILKFHTCYSIWQDLLLFLRLNNIIACECVSVCVCLSVYLTFPLSIHPFMSI